jgi:uncharacterized protein (TIGR00725 family)
MKIKVGVMGSAADTLSDEAEQGLRAKVEQLGRAIAARGLIVLTGATTGAPYLVGQTARAAGAWHVGISPAQNEREHMERYKLPTDACDAIIYTGFGLKGRNVVLVRSSDIALFVGGSIGSLNEFTIAHDEGRVVGCLTGTGGTADEVRRLLQVLPRKTGAQVVYNEDPEQLLNACLAALREAE